MPITAEDIASRFGLAATAESIMRRTRGEQVEAPEGMEFRYGPEGRVALQQRGRAPRFDLPFDRGFEPSFERPEDLDVSQYDLPGAPRLEPPADTPRQQRIDAARPTQQMRRQAVQRAPQTFERLDSPEVQDQLREQQRLLNEIQASRVDTSPEAVARRMGQARPDVPILRGAAAGLQRNIVGTTGLVQRVLGDQQAADRTWRTASTIGEGDAWADQMVAGSVDSVLTMMQGALGGPAGVIGRFVVGAANDAAGEGREAGLQGPRLVRHVLGQAAVEGVITTAFQLAGLGGLESLARKQAARAGIAAAAKSLGLSTLAELPEELLIEATSAVASELETIQDVTPERLRDVFAQTILTVGLAGSPRFAAQASRGVSRRGAGTTARAGTQAADMGPSASQQPVNIEAAADPEAAAAEAEQAAQSAVEAAQAQPELLRAAFGDNAEQALRDLADNIRQGMSPADALAAVRQQAMADAAEAAPRGATEQQQPPGVFEAGQPVTFQIHTSSLPKSGVYVGEGPGGTALVRDAADDRLYEIGPSGTVAAAGPVAAEPAGAAEAVAEPPQQPEAPEPPAQPQAQQAAAEPPRRPDAAPARPADPEREAVERFARLDEQVRSAHPSFRDATAVPISELSADEQAVIRFFSDRGTVAQFYRGVDAMRAVAMDAGVALRQGMGIDDLMEAAFHEAAHAYGIDQLADVFTPKQIERARDQYRKMAEAAGIEVSEQGLNREAVALLVGQMARNKTLRQRILKRQPGFAQRVLDNLRRLAELFTGRSEAMERIIAEFEVGLGATQETREQQAEPTEADQQAEASAEAAADERDAGVAAEAAREAAAMAEGAVTPAETQAAVGETDAARADREARARARSAGEQRVIAAGQVAAEERAGRTPEEQQRFEREEQAAARSLGKLKGAAFDTSPEVTDLLVRSLSYVDTGRPLDYTAEQKTMLREVRGQSGDRARELVYQRALEGDGDAIGMIVAANAHNAVRAARRMQGPGSVAEFESLVYAGINGALRFLQSRRTTMEGKKPVWLRLRNNIESAVQQAATPAQKNPETQKVERVLRQGAASLDAAAEEAGPDGRSAAEVIAATPDDTETLAARDAITGYVAELMQQELPADEIRRRVIEHAASYGFEVGDLQAMFLPSEIKHRARRRAAMFLPSLQGTETPEFRRWFRASRVVDEQGRPLAVHHAVHTMTTYRERREQRDPFTAFYPMSHFGSVWAATERAIGGSRVGSRMKLTFGLPDPSVVTDEDIDAQYVEDARRRWHPMDLRGVRVYPVYLSLQNPAYVSDTEANNPDELFKRLAALDNDPVKKNRQERHRIANEEVLGYGEGRRQMSGLLELYGYDGMIYTNNVEDPGSMSAVAVYPEQIKSVFNVGTWGQAAEQPQSPETAYSFSIGELTERDPQDIRFLPAVPVERITNPDRRTVRGMLKDVRRRMEEEIARNRNAISDPDVSMLLRAVIMPNGDVEAWNADSNVLHLDVSRRGIPLEIYADFAQFSQSYDRMVGGDQFSESAQIAQEKLGDLFPDLDFAQMGDPDDNAYFLPSRPERLTPEEAQRRLLAAIAESPKVQGRPELANPGETEQQRRLMDAIDAAMAEQGLPERQTVAVWKSGAARILQNAGERAAVEQMLDAGAAFEVPEQTYAAKAIWRERADAALAGTDEDAWRSAIAAAYGYRRSGTETARVLRSRLDEVKSPAERIAEFVASTLTDPPQHLLGKRRRGDEGGIPPIETAAMKRYIEAVEEMFARWKRQGIDWRAIDATLASNPSSVYRIVKDTMAIKSAFGQSRFDPIAEIYRNFLMSAPITFIRNMTGGGYAVADTLLYQPLAAAIERATRGRKSSRSLSAQLAGVKAIADPAVLARGIRNFAMAAYHEVPVFDLDVDSHGAWQEVEWKKPVAIGGEPLLRQRADRQAKLPQFNSPDAGATMRERAKFRAQQAKYVAGRTIRLPQLFNMAMDQFVKTVHAHAMVTSFAVRAAERAGMRGTNADRWVRGQVRDLSSESWTAAIATHDTSRIAFQAPSGGLSGVVEQSLIKARRAVPALHLLFPFVKTPTQLITESLWMTPGLGTAGIVGKAVAAKARKRDAAFRGGSREMALRVAQQMVGYGMLAMLWDYVDDEEGPLKVTGAASYAREDRQERLGREVVEPYFSINIGGKWYNYRNLDPYTVTIAGTASIARELKRAMRGEQGYVRQGETRQTAVGRLMRQMTSMYGDIPALKAVGDAQKLLSDHEYWGPRIGMTLGAGWMPNIVRNTARSQDELRRDSRWLSGEPAPGTGQRLWRQMFPVGDHLGPPRVTVFGSPVQKDDLDKQSGFATTTAIRMLSPVARQWTPADLEGRLLKMVVAWNDNHWAEPQNVRWFVEPRPTFTMDRGGLKNERVEPNEEEWLLYQRLAGRMALQEARQWHRRHGWNFDQPTTRDMEALNKIMEGTRTRARDAIKAAITFRLEDQPARRDQVMTRVRDAIHEMDGLSAPARQSTSR